MARTHDAAPRRADVLRRVVEETNARRDGVLPMDLPGVGETFGDELSLIAALQMRWHTRLSGRIEQALSEHPTDPEHAVLAAWRATATELDGVRRVLDRFTEQPTSPEMERALRTSRRKDWTLMAAMAGCAGIDTERAVRVGRALEQQARAVALAA
ncbi:MAG: hypothetical protein ACTHKG_07505 [Nocardioides sp.]